MFEKAKSISHAQIDRFSAEQAFDEELLIGSADVAADQEGRGGTALRMVEWSELKARLNAARDLRQVLRRDARGNIEANGNSFADAAAQYFRTKEESAENQEKQNKRDVNPVALGGSKASPRMTQELKELRDEETTKPGHAAAGDARED